MINMMADDEMEEPMDVDVNQQESTLGAQLEALRLEMLTKQFVAFKDKMAMKRLKPSTSASRRGGNRRNAVVRENISAINNKITRGVIPAPPRPIKIGSINYWENHTLGHGGTATVYNGYYESEEVPAAVKVIPKDKYKYYKSEIDVLRWIVEKEKDNAHLVKYFATQEDERNYFIAMQKAQFTLCDLISPDESKKKKVPKLKIYEILSILKQTGQGLEAMHTYKRKSHIVHRDVKPANILLFFSGKDEGDRKVTAKLSDFGISKELKNVESTTTRPEGTENWMSPECLRALEDQENNRGSQINYNATLEEDIFCFGMVIYWAMFRGEHPFGTRAYRIFNIMKGNPVYLRNITSESFVVINLVHSMFSAKKEGRPSIATVLKHPLFWSYEKKLKFVTTASNAMASPTNSLVIVNKHQSIKLVKKVALYDIPRLKQKAESYTDCICTCNTSTGWIDHLSVPFRDLIVNREASKPNAKRYKGKSIMSLAEFIRDKYQHRTEWGDDVIDSIGGTSDGDNYMKYFDDKFPMLVPLLFLHLQDYAFSPYCRDDDLKKFYPDDKYVFNMEGVENAKRKECA